MTPPEPFWKSKSLEQMTDQEWESLCDGCARCCLVKLEDADTGELHFTNISCHLLDIEQCRCADYANRRFRVPECMLVRKMQPAEYSWLPETCAYRLLSEGKSLPLWHPLISGDVLSVNLAGIAVNHLAISEDRVQPDQFEDHIIELPGVLVTNHDD